MPTRKSPERKVRSRGAKRMKERGRKLVQLWLDKTEAAAIESAAQFAHEKVATWIRRKAVHAAEADHRERIQKQQRDTRSE